MDLTSLITPGSLSAGGGILLAGYAIYTLSRLVGNHIDHSTQSVQKLTDMIERLTDLIEKKL